MSSKPTMTRLAKDYLAYRRKFGFELQDVGRILLRFARYADRSGHRGPVTTELAVRWAGLAQQASGAHLARRLGIVRNFAKYLAIFDPKTEIPPHNVFGPAYRRVPPYIYTPGEISTLLAAAQDLRPKHALRPHTYATLFGLLACTGLRLGEALRLARPDVDCQRGLLTIRNTKFRKSRLVPLHATTMEALRAYARLRDRHYPMARSDAFFLSMLGTGLSSSSVHGTFVQLRRQLSWLPTNGKRAPRIHDLRHTFACRRLILWHEQGVSVDHRLMALSTYLGHVSVSNTYWYLTGVPELLEWASAQLENFSPFRAGGQT